MSTAQTAQIREYETIYILRPDVSVEAARKVATRMEEVTVRENGKLTLVENWGRRQLSYPLKKCRRGVYVYFKYVGAGQTVSELERNLRLFDEVLKYQTVQVSKHVDAENLKVAPEDAVFADIQPPAADEPEETREEVLGLEFSKQLRRDDEADMMMDDDDEPLSLRQPQAAQPKEEE